MFALLLVADLSFTGCVVWEGEGERVPSGVVVPFTSGFVTPVVLVGVLGKSFSGVVGVRFSWVVGEDLSVEGVTCLLSGLVGVEGGVFSVDSDLVRDSFLEGDCAGSSAAKTHRALLEHSKPY